MQIVNDQRCSWINDLVIKSNIKILQKNEECEWLIIGDGYRGLSAARKLAQLDSSQKKGITIFIEIILNQELSELLRGDAMKKSILVACINKSDLKSQKLLI